MSKFPQPFTSTESYWQATNKGPTSLFDHGRDADLPATADYVIVGAGMTGASLAYQLTRPGSAGTDKSLVVLEAKDVASGASGRNGGHLCPATSHAFPALLAPLAQGGAGVDAEEAVRIIEDELDNYRTTVGIIEDEGWTEDVGLWKGSLLDVYFEADQVETRRNARNDWLRARKAFGLPPDISTQFIDNPEEAQRISRNPQAVGVAVRPAGSVQPHKLATKLLQSALSSSVPSRISLFSWTPTQSIERDPTSSTWIVGTDRGTIRAQNVILATNAHTPHLVPKGSLVKDHITPVRGHASHILPPSTFPPVAYTYGFENGPYLVSPYAKPNGDSTTTSTSSSPVTNGHPAKPRHPPIGKEGFVMGVGWGVAVAEGIAKRSEMLGVTDDSVVLPGVEKYLADYCKKTFADWPAETPGKDGLLRVWTGIMAYSRDVLPLVGSIEDGLWIAAGFHGHGMSRIVNCTRALAHTLLTSTWDARLPRSFELTNERLERAAREAPPLIKMGKTVEGGDVVVDGEKVEEAVELGKW